jgi:hypothetical protein
MVVYLDNHLSKVLKIWLRTLSWAASGKAAFRWLMLAFWHSERELSPKEPHNRDQYDGTDGGSG